MFNLKLEFQLKFLLLNCSYSIRLCPKDIHVLLVHLTNLNIIEVTFHYLLYLLLVLTSKINRKMNFFNLGLIRFNDYPVVIDLADNNNLEDLIVVEHHLPPDIFSFIQQPILLLSKK